MFVTKKGQKAMQEMILGRGRSCQEALISLEGNLKLRRRCSQEALLYHQFCGHNVDAQGPFCGHLKVRPVIVKGLRSWSLIVVLVIPPQSTRPGITLRPCYQLHIVMKLCHIVPGSPQECQTIAEVAADRDNF